MLARTKQNPPQNKQVYPDWTGEPVAIIASGPSLNQDDVDYLKGKCKVIAVNDNYSAAPFANVLYACDLKWWNWHEGAPGFRGEKWTQDITAANKYDLNYIASKSGKGLSIDPKLIHTGQNSGFQAINLAYHFGAKDIYLLGFDMQVSEHGAAHWFGNHPDEIISNYTPWLKHFNEIKAQKLVNIVNCSNHSKITAFETKPIQDAI